MDNGWVKLHRKVLDNPVVMKDAEYFAVWVYLLLNATHNEYPMLFKGSKIMLQPGQLITGRIALSRALGISGSKVYRILESFKNEHQIEQQISNKNSLITIINWDEYQNAEHQIEQQLNISRTTGEQQANTNKNVKNDKNVKNVRNTVLCDFDAFWKVYPKKVGKGDALKAFGKISVPVEVLIKAVEQQKLSERWIRENGRYIPNPSTWLNQGRWEDELEPADVMKLRPGDIDVERLPVIVHPKRKEKE